MEHDEKLWRQYDQHITTYKFYLEMTVKIMTMYFVISGAMLSFYFTKTDIPSAQYALILPFVMGVGLFSLFLIGAKLSMVTREDVFVIRDQLKLDTSPELGVLPLTLTVFSIVLAICCLGIAYVIWMGVANN